MLFFRQGYREVDDDRRVTTTVSEYFRSHNYFFFFSSDKKIIIQRRYLNAFRFLRRHFSKKRANLNIPRFETSTYLQRHLRFSISLSRDTYLAFSTRVPPPRHRGQFEKLMRESDLIEKRFTSMVLTFFLNVDRIARLFEQRPSK